MSTLLKENIERIYRADVFSCSYLLCLTFSLATIIIPFFLAFSTYNFWSPYSIYTEQPIVLYRNELLIAIYSETRLISGSSIITTPSTNFYSTLGELNQLSGASLIPVDIVAGYWDYNADLKPDMHDFNLTFYIPSKNIRNIKIITNYDYKLRERVSMEMMSMAIADIQTPRGASSIYIDGILKFNQVNPLPSTKMVQTNYNSSLLDYTNPSQNFFPDLFARYMNRNESTTYVYQSTVLPDGQSEKVTISMKIRIPPFEHIYYAPLFIENLKFAWIQYLSLLIPIYYLVWLFAKFVFSNQIFDTPIEIKY